MAKRGILFGFFLLSAVMTSGCSFDPYGAAGIAYAVGDLLGSYDSSYAYPETHRFEVNGTKGRILIEDTVKRLTFNRVDDPVAQVWQSTYFDDEARYFAGSHDRHMADIIRCFREGSPPPVPARQGYEVLRVCHAAIRSHLQGKRIHVSEVK